MVGSFTPYALVRPKVPPLFVITVGRPTGSGRSTIAKANDVGAERVSGARVQLVTDPAIGNTVVPQAGCDGDFPRRGGGSIRGGVD